MSKITFNKLQFEEDFNAEELKSEQDWHDTMVNQYKMKMWGIHHALFKHQEESLYGGIFDEYIPSELLSMAYMGIFKNYSSGEGAKVSLSEWLKDPENLASAVEDAFMQTLQQAIHDKLQEMSELINSEDMKYDISLLKNKLI